MGQQGTVISGRQWLSEKHKGKGPCFSCKVQKHFNIRDVYLKKMVFNSVLESYLSDSLLWQDLAGWATSFMMEGKLEVLGAWGSHMKFHSGQQRTKKAKERAPILWGNLKCFQILGTSGLETAVMGTKGSQSPGVLASVYTDWQAYIQGSWMGASLPARPCIWILWPGMWGSMWMCSRASLI